MADLAELFANAREEVVTLTHEPDNQVKLELYSLFKQATTGDATGDRPGMFNVVARAKYDAHAGLRGMSPDDAMRHYVDLVASLKAHEARR